MSKRSWDLLAVMSMALLAVAGSAALGDGALSAGRSNPILVALTLPLLLFAPGYALSSAVLPGRALGLAERLLLSLGLSMAIVVLGGLLLNFLPFGLTPGAWRFFLLGVTLTAGGYGLWWRERHSAPGPGPVVTQISIRETVLLSGAALLIGLTLGLSALGIDPVARTARAKDPFTQFWAIPTQSGQQTVVRLGLQNYENESVTYRVTLESGDRTLAEWPRVSIPDGDTWQAQATLPANLADQEISAKAYREDETVPYRQIRLRAGKLDDQ